MQIDRRNKHSSNADFPKIETLEPASNVKFERVQQSLKQALEIVSTDEGIQIDSRDEHI
jgi:hypothetical protein